METKKIFGALLIIIGGIGLTIGIFGIFKQFQIANTNPWAYAILGAFFFLSGISLVRSIRSANAD
ncbi:MAG: hypothetical protein IPJ74_01175 [Saprospiraceae bacterium]|nr:hypothetical protein [Saprospiraceae bacterium]